MRLLTTTLTVCWITAISIAQADDSDGPVVAGKSFVEWKRMLVDRDKHVRDSAKTKLRILAPVPAIADGLKHDNWKVRYDAAFLLSRIGPGAKSAVPGLIETLKDSTTLVRKEAAHALGHIGPEASQAVPALIDTLKDKTWCVRWASAMALGNIGPDAKPAVPALTKALEDEHHRVRALAASSLGDIGFGAMPAVPELLARSEELIVKCDGVIRCLYDEAVDLDSLGSLTIQRGSHVEPDASGNWLADLAPVSGPVLGPFDRRSDALAAERDWLEQNWLCRG